MKSRKVEYKLTETPKVANVIVNSNIHKDLGCKASKHTYLLRGGVDSYLGAVEDRHGEHVCLGLSNRTVRSDI